MTTPAEHPYGSEVMGSKYQGQQGPTPSRYFENFRARRSLRIAAASSRAARTG